MAWIMNIVLCNKKETNLCYKVWCLCVLYSSLLKQWTLNYLDKKVPHCVLRFITLPLIYWIWTQKCKSEVYFQELLQFIPPFVLKWNTTPIPNAIQNLFFSLIKNITHKPSPKQNSKNLSPQPIIPKTYQFLPCGLQIIYSHIVGDFSKYKSIHSLA